MKQNDIEDAMELLKTFDKIKPKRGELLECINLTCAVRPLPRPRWSGNHIYQPKENQKELLFEVMQEHSLMVPAPKRIEIPVIVDHYIQYTKNSKVKDKFPISNNIGDYDNLSKAINDALVISKFLKDDNIIPGGETFKFYDPDYGAIDLCTVFIYKAVLEKE